MTKWLWKWLVCSWLHRRHRCYPIVWNKSAAKEYDLPWPTIGDCYWHCHKCHPCNEAINKLLAEEQAEAQA